MRCLLFQLIVCLYVDVAGLQDSANVTHDHRLRRTNLQSPICSKTHQDQALSTILTKATMCAITFNFLPTCKHELPTIEYGIDASEAVGKHNKKRERGK